MMIMVIYNNYEYEDGNDQYINGQMDNIKMEKIVTRNVMLVMRFIIIIS